MIHVGGSCVDVRVLDREKLQLFLERTFSRSAYTRTTSFFQPKKCAYIMMN